MTKQIATDKSADALSWARGTATSTGQKGCQRRASLPHTRAPGRGFHGFDTPPGARSWFQYHHASETARLPDHGPGQAWTHAAQVNTALLDFIRS
jgi:hypothetical protein